MPTWRHLSPHTGDDNWHTLWLAPFLVVGLPTLLGLLTHSFPVAVIAAFTVTVVYPLVAWLHSVAPADLPEPRPPLL